MNKYDPNTAADVFAVADWVRPDFCGTNGGNCVEVNLGVSGIVGMRDAKVDAGPVLIFDDDEWTAFTQSVRAGQYDR